jgi:formylglycine-generating enzyme
VPGRKTATTAFPALLLLPAGSFVMGNNEGRPDERPAHRVSLPAFRAARRPVSNAEYRAFVEATGYAAPPFWTQPRFDGRELPVVGVSWFDAVAFCRWLSTELGEAIRLPSEAEREYASLGGLAGVDWPWGNEPPECRQELAHLLTLDRPHAPAERCVNGYGLLCMADNVHEWCSDWYDPAYYASSPEHEPQGSIAGKRRASRGGSWRHMIKFNRLSSRSSLDPSFRYNDYGFRVYANA